MDGLAHAGDTDDTDELDEAGLRRHGDPDCVAALLALAPDLDPSGGPLGIRAIVAAAFQAAPPMLLPTDVRVRTVEADGARPWLRVYEPVEHRLPGRAILWIHGGGLILGTPLQDELLCAGLAVEHGCAVVATSYRLAPEHRYPAALDDCMATLEWMLDPAAGFALDPLGLVIEGASAGGGLAAAVGLRTARRGDNRDRRATPALPHAR